ncbi:hypothetical protein JS530_06170 [Bifidobacterium sp. LC6]|uniref:Carbon starvation protein n=1 Tax=Bifidobacterium colobi TaxID=2809026 RepID=A0ABS5UWE0_9BIFI|nr:hypothetical protein [Bifidobacterium colobi]MBT1175088.1 hypothetical protein [Bifidobacterium colobi]
MNDRSRMMLYALIAAACVVWIYQSVKESVTSGIAIGTSNIIFLVCIGIAALYCTANALMLWWHQPGKDDEASSESGEDTENTEDVIDSDTADDKVDSAQSDHSSKKEQ